jgi:hypothetical protein
MRSEYQIFPRRTRSIVRLGSAKAVGLIEDRTATQIARLVEADQSIPQGAGSESASQ